ncbi:hypothetical protein KAR91_62290 [Candidatus Pacearchaeota archaeon]|nr:hypothetical protein [Candidatus Pacearchaeota archaeon]
MSDKDYCKNCIHFEWLIENRGNCTLTGTFEPVTINFSCEEFKKQPPRNRDSQGG